MDENNHLKQRTDSHCFTNPQLLDKPKIQANIRQGRQTCIPKESFCHLHLAANEQQDAVQGLTLAVFRHTLISCVQLATANQTEPLK